MKNPATPAGLHLWTAALALIVLVPIACSGGDTPAAPADNDPLSEVAGMASGDGGHHDHGSSVEVAEGVPVSTISIEVSEDPVEGWNLRVITTDFRIVPENVSTAHIDGEGHMHLYIDGEKVSRLYGEWHHIGPLAPGEHEVRVELSANDHSAMAVDGDIIDATTVIVAPETGDHATGHSHTEPREASEPHPSVAVELVDDPAGGWSLHAVPSNFRLAPENASGNHVDGEGHMHLYINGKKVARIYETWYQTPPLPAGTHEITVALQTNDHAPLTAGGSLVETSITLEVSEDEATMPDDHEASTDDPHDHHDHDHDHGSAGEPTRYDADLADAVQTITVDVAGGAPVGGVQRVEVDLGSVVALMVTSDIAEEVHVHGYDILRAVSEGHPARFAFTAEIPGVLEVELEDSGRLLLLLEIS
ncbi:MAG: hypothetical protein F4X38_05910 [Acidimicrobiaceae bacterium]|nr:hypothetical protein [Acidimicrobiaceae bacterium]